MISYLSGEHSGRLIKHLRALEWPPTSPDVGFFFQGYIKNKIWDAPPFQQPIAIIHALVAVVRE